MTLIQHMPEDELRREYITPGKSRLDGELVSRKHSAGVVLFCPETRVSAQLYNAGIARTLNRHKLSTFIPALLLQNKDGAAQAPLAAQIGETAEWLHEWPESTLGPLGCYAMGQEAGAAALRAAVLHQNAISAAVVCGGRPHLVPEILAKLKIPVLLIAGGRDAGGVRSSQRALEILGPNCAMNVIPRASFFLEEPGVTEETAQLAALWFLEHLDRH